MVSEKEITINDCFVDVTRKEPTNKEIAYISANLPSEVTMLAERWGWNDTEVGDKTYRWISNNVNEIINLR